MQIRHKSIHGTNTLLVTFVLLITFMMSSTALSEEITLTWWVNRHDVEMPFWEHMARRFEEDNPGISVQIINAMGQGGRDQLMTLILSGMAPDLIRGETDWMADYAGQDIFLDMTSYMDRDQTELNLDEFPQPALDAFNWQGTQYALPMVLSSLVYKYNKVMFDEAGVAYPHGDWTWDEFAEVSQQLTRHDHSGNIVQYGVQIPRGIGNRAVVWLWQNGGDLFNNDYTQILIDQPENVEALDFVRGLMHDQQVASTPQAESRLGSDLFERKIAAGQLNGPWRRGALNAVHDLEWDIAPLPHNKQNSTVILAGGIAVSSFTRYPEESWRLAKFLTGTEAQYIWADNGQSSPARIPVALSNSFLGSGPPDHARYYIEVIAQGRPEPSFPGWSNLRTSLEQVLRPFWNGDLDAQRAAVQAKAQGQAMIDQLN